MRSSMVLILAGLSLTVCLPAQPVAVRQTEGTVRGFLVLRNEAGQIIANGDSIQTTKGGQITNRLTYHFKDGSLQEETTVYTQNRNFRVVSYRQIQKGPAFKNSLDMTINGLTGHVTVRSTDDKGKEKNEESQLKPMADLVNGMVPVVLKNLPAGALSLTQSMTVATPKPLAIKLQISREGEDTFTTGSTSHTAIRYLVHIDIPGIKGVIAPIVGKQPPDAHVWISTGDCPSFVKGISPAFEGGPMWTTELASPSWPQSQK